MTGFFVMNNSCGLSEIFEVAEVFCGIILISISISISISILHLSVMKMQ